MMFSEDCMWTVLDIVVVASSIWEIVLRIIFTIQARPKPVCQSLRVTRRSSMLGRVTESGFLISEGWDQKCGNCHFLNDIAMFIARM